jgi:hypothetical protein
MKFGPHFSNNFSNIFNEYFDAILEIILSRFLFTHRLARRQLTKLKEIGCSILIRLWPEVLLVTAALLQHELELQQQPVRSRAAAPGTCVLLQTAYSHPCRTAATVGTGKHDKQQHTCRKIRPVPVKFLLRHSPLFGLEEKCRIFEGFHPQGEIFLHDPLEHMIKSNQNL